MKEISFEEHKKAAWSCHPFNLQGNVELGLETGLQLLVGLNEQINEVSDLQMDSLPPSHPQLKVQRNKNALRVPEM